ncbi:MAG: hypothetical protein JWP12_1331 [Bacteroidetes bacterium]|nr:hypothetical protein [Bacteroidota bacterium]
MHTNKTYSPFLFLLICISMNFAFSGTAAAQTISQSKAAARYEIDAKRIGVGPNDKDALPRSREFIRLDSTYYVGWMYEGIYKYERSADYLGFKYALPSLEKALNLLEKDYGDKIKNVYSSFTYYNEYNNRMADLYELAYTLSNCYNSIEMPDSAMALYDRMDRYKLQRDYFGIDEERAWTYHRNRFFTSEKYPFLKNSVEENEQMAFQCCYKQLARIEKNKDVNDYWYGARQSYDDKLSTYHYLSMLHCYNQNYDSSSYYYTLLVDGGRVSWGNYAGMQHEIGNIDTAIAFYEKPHNAREHSLSESDYFLPTLYIYGGKTKQAISRVQEKIQSSGSTPGFGWYNIALGRSYLYDGQLDSAELFLDKAANFKELHINTTLTQSQYEFTINLLKVQLLDKKMQQIKFLNKGWWYSISNLVDLVTLKVKKLMMEYVVVNELVNNPERKRIVYDLFCAESTVSFDETTYLLKDFSTPYFREKYEAYQLRDKRIKAQKYFKLLLAKLELENGDDKKASAIADDILQNEFTRTSPEGDLRGVDTAYEKLFVARLYELMSHTYEDNGNKTAFAEYSNKYYEEFPQLVPFSGIRMKMKLSTSGISDAVTKQVIDNLKGCNIDWTTESSANIPEVTLVFDKKGKLYEAVINVKGGSGTPVVTDQQMIFKDAKGTGKELALRIFGKGGEKEYEEVVVTNK